MTLPLLAVVMALAAVVSQPAAAQPTRPTHPATRVKARTIASVKVVKVKARVTATRGTAAVAAARTSAPKLAPASVKVALPSVPVTAPLRDRVVFGASVGSLPTEATDLAALESTLGAHLGIASSYVDWTHVLGGPQELALAQGGRRAVLLSWESFGIRFTDVTSGAQNAYLNQVVQSMRQYPYPLYVRLWPEMNGSWSSWQPTGAGSKPNGGTPSQFIAAWRYVVTYMRTRGVTNLKFVFNPDASNGTLNTPIASIWPGAQYVDVLGIDGYNWGQSALGPTDTGDTWRTFTQVFSSMYQQLTALDATAPVWITEFGSKEPTKEDDSSYPRESSPIDPLHSKGAWLTDLMSLRTFPQLKALVYFNKLKERDWRLESSAASLAAIRAQLALATRGA